MQKSRERPQCDLTSSSGKLKHMTRNVNNGRSGLSRLMISRNYQNLSLLFIDVHYPNEHENVPKSVLLDFFLFWWAAGQIESLKQPARKSMYVSCF